MRDIRLIARLDINNEFVVKGKFLEGLRKVGRPADLANKYYNHKIDEIIFLDAVASLYDRNSLIDLIKKTSETIFVPITVGGGIRTIKDIQNALDAGADKVAINSRAIEDISFLKEAVRLFGSQAIVGSIVARKNRKIWEAFKDNAKHRTGKDAIEWAVQLVDAGVGELMITSIDKDGLEKGFDVELISKISNAVSVPVIAGSGAGNSQHIVELCSKTNCDAVAVGSILHYERESVMDIKMNLKLNGFVVR